MNMRMKARISSTSSRYFSVSRFPFPARAAARALALVAGVAGAAAAAAGCGGCGGAVLVAAMVSAAVLALLLGGEEALGLLVEVDEDAAAAPAAARLLCWVVVGLWG